MISTHKLLALLCIQLVAYCPTILGDELIRYAAVIYRHGDRTPVNQFPTDPYKNESLWPVKFGQLTNIGKEQHYELGQWLRTHYNNLISENFDPTEIYVRSTNVDRTLMSAMANLAGMYPPVEASIWNPRLPWQPIPVHTMPEEEDEILSMQKKCPNFDVLKSRLKNSAAYKERLQKYKTLMDYLSEYAGLEVKDYDDISSIYSVLKIEKLYNFSLPEWTSKVFPNQMVEPAGYSFTTDTATPLMARLKVGPFLKEVIRNMVKMMHYHDSQFPDQDVWYEDWDKKRPLKLNIYSAHDLNIGSVLNGLGLYDGRCPEYTSMILFELVYDDVAQIHFVKILYRNTTKIEEPIVLPIPNCTYHCSLESFIKIYNDIIPVDWKDECRIKFPLTMALTYGVSLFLFCLCVWYYYLCGRIFSRTNLLYSTLLPDRTTLQPNDAKPNS